MTKQKLTYYTGNFDTYTKTVKENEVIQQKKYEKEQDDIKHLKAFISSCGKLSDLLQPAVCTADLPLLLTPRLVLVRSQHTTCHSVSCDCWHLQCHYIGR